MKCQISVSAPNKKHPEPEVRGVFDWVQFQKKTVNYRVNFPFSILHPQFYIYSK